MLIGAPTVALDTMEHSIGAKPVVLSNKALEGLPFSKRLCPGGSWALKLVLYRMYELSFSILEL